MGYKVIMAPQAIDRLAQIVRFIAQDKPDVAEQFGIKLIDHARLLGDFPELGQPYRKRPNVRRIFFKPYFIYYRIHHEKQIVEIMEYWHSARQEPEL